MSMKIALFTGGYSNYPLERAFQRSMAMTELNWVDLDHMRMHRIWQEEEQKESSNYQEIIICRLLIMFQKILALHIA